MAVGGHVGGGWAVQPTGIITEDSTNQVTGGSTRGRVSLQLLQGEEANTENGKWILHI